MDKLQQKLRQIFKKFPADSGRCSQCAVQVFNLLTEAGIKASIVRIQTRLPFLSTRKGLQLARRIGNDRAYHEFVQTEDRIFDALTDAEGMEWKEYRNLFYENAFDDGTIQIVSNTGNWEASREKDHEQ